MMALKMFHHHWYIVKMLVNKLKDNKNVEFKWNHMTRPDVMRRPERAAVRGQGLGFMTGMHGLVGHYVLLCTCRGLLAG